MVAGDIDAHPRRERRGGALAVLSSLLGRGGAAPALAVAGPRPNAAYMRDGRGMVFSRWRPFLRSAQDDVAPAIDAAAARTIDLAQNTGWIAGMIDQATANTVGLGLRLRAEPENELIGMSEEYAQQWRKLVEARFNLWANNPLECDIEGTRTLAQMQEAAFKHWFATGEILAELVRRTRPESKSRLKVRLLSSTRLVNRTSEFERIFSGVRVNEDGMPVSYIARRRSALLGDTEVEVRARDQFGRPNVIHVFTGAPEQRRGITVLVPVLRVAKQYDQLADATLLASIIQTVFAASITSDMPTEDALRSLLSPREQAQLMATGGSPFDAWFEAQAGWSDGHPIDVGYAGRIAHMFPGEKLEFHTPNQPNAFYKDLSLHLIREMARCCGLTYESASGDYSGATYSSVRAGSGEVFVITRARRKFVLSPMLTPVFQVWLEDEIEAGLIPFPGGIGNFRRYRDAASRCSWAGDPKPVADDQKAAKTHETYQSMGVLPDAVIANDLGLDIEDVYAQRAREKALRTKYGLPENKTVATIEAQAANNAPTDDGAP